MRVCLLLVSTMLVSMRLLSTTTVRAFSSSVPSLRRLPLLHPQQSVLAPPCRGFVAASTTALFVSPFLTPCALASLEQSLTGGFCQKSPAVRCLLDPLSPSLLELKSTAAASATKGITPIDKIGNVFDTMDDHFASNNRELSSLSKEELIHDLPSKAASCHQRSVLFKWLCDEVVAGGDVGGDTRFRLLFGELHTPREALPIHHAWVDITFNGEGAPATWRVDATRRNGNLEPFLFLNKNNGQPEDDDIDEVYHAWIAQSIARCNDLGVTPTKDALDALVAGLATPQALSAAEVFSTAMAVIELGRRGLLPQKREYIDPLFREIKQRIESGDAGKETIPPRELAAMQGWVEHVEGRRRRPPGHQRRPPGHQPGH